VSYARVSFDNPVYFGGDDDPLFWRLQMEAAPHTAVPMECLWTLYLMAKQSLNVPGEFWECGVDRGGSARFIADTIGKRPLRLFDTFSGMPEGDPAIDFHGKGEFPTTLKAVKEYVGHADTVLYMPGLIPDTFAGLEDAQIAFAHIDCDLYASTRACCEFIYPRVVRGGVMIFDDYARPTCPGVLKAVSEYFADKPSVPLPNISSAQAVVFKL
jgi:O-methyltransferase